MDPTDETSPSEPKNVSLKTSIAEGLRGQPAYLLVFGALVVILGGGAGAVAFNNWTGALVVIVPTVVLLVLIIFIVERNRPASVPVPPPTVDQESLPGLSQLRRAMSDVLGEMIDNSKKTYFVYSATPVKHFYDHAGKLIKYPYLNQELEVTSIRDAQAISMIHSILYFGGKNDRLFIVTSNGFQDEFWGANLILIGSGNSNTKTQVALTDDGLRSPFFFSPDMMSIREKNGTRVWPSNPAQLEDWDYAILAKLEPPGAGNRIYLIAAGIGPTGTLAACNYLETSLGQLHSRFGAAPFAVVLKMRRSLGFASATEEAAERL